MSSFESHNDRIHRWKTLDPAGMEQDKASYGRFSAKCARACPPEIITLKYTLALRCVLSAACASALFAPPVCVRLGVSRCRHGMTERWACFPACARLGCGFAPVPCNQEAV